MKIAIDVHYLESQAGGNESYCQQLLQGLASDRSDNRYTLFHTPSASKASIQTDARFELVRIPDNPLIRLGFTLPWQLKNTKPDVFHCQYIRPLFGNIKTVVSIHDLAFEHFPEFFHPLECFWLKRLVRSTARHADHIVTPSKFSAADIAAQYEIPPEKITVTYLAAAERFQPRDKRSSQEHIAKNYGIEGPFILYVGRLQGRKNLPRLVEAFSRLRKQGLPARLVLVGGKNWQFQQLQSKINELGAGPEVSMPGYVSTEDLPHFYNAAEMFVFPSLIEGFGLPVLEGMASGIPVITSQGSALEEIAGDAAHLVDPLDVSSIANAIQKVYEDLDWRRELVKRGLRRSSEFKTENLALKVLEVYRSL